MEKEFIKNNKNISKTAKELNYSVKVITRNLDDYKIERNKNNRNTNYLHRDRDWLYNEYCVLKTDINSRRNIVSAWNPSELNKMALPPCHWAFQLVVENDKLCLLWNQRSWDLFLGAPMNIASYAMLLLLICKQTGLKPGWLKCYATCVHIYDNHIKCITEQITRLPKELPEMKIITNSNNWTIFDWNSSTDWELIGYNPYPAIKATVAV